MVGDPSYPPLHSGGSRAIFSMAEDDLADRKAFFNGLAYKCRQWGYPNGSEAFDAGNRRWAFF